jgi:hypothetical protein
MPVPVAKLRLPMPVPVPKFVVERLTWEMAQWEIHALRGLVTVLVIQVQVYAKEHPEARPLASALVSFKTHMKEAQLEAFMDPIKRRMRPD